MLNDALKAVRQIAVAEGLAGVTRFKVADLVGVSEVQLWRIAKGGIKEMIDAVVKNAIFTNDTEMIARALQADHPLVKASITDDQAKLIRSAHPDLSDSRLHSARQHGANDKTKKIYMAADELVLAFGFPSVTREAIAKRANVSAGSVSNAFGDMSVGLPYKLLTWAIEREDVNMIARGLQIDHPIAKNAPEHLKQAAAKLIIE